MQVGLVEGAIILLVVILLFGARRLPELGKSLGQGIKEFKHASKGLLDDDEKPAEKTEEHPAKP